jgi:hypothetical protein
MTCNQLFPGGKSVSPTDFRSHALDFSPLAPPLPSQPAKKQLMGRGFIRAFATKKLLIATRLVLVLHHEYPFRLFLETVLGYGIAFA